MTPEDVDSLQSISRPNTASDGLSGVAHTGEMVKFVQTLRTPRFRKAHTSTELPALGFETPKNQGSPEKMTPELGPSPKPPKEPRRGASQRLRSMGTWPRAAWRAALHRSVSRSSSRPASRISRSASGCSQSRTTWKLKQQHSQTPALPECPWAEKIYHRRQVILQRRRELTSPVKHVQLKEVIGSAASSRRPSSEATEEISELKPSSTSMERREKYKESQSGLEDDEADDDRRSPRGSKQIRKAPSEQARPAGEVQFEESFPVNFRIFDKRRTCQFLGDSDEEEEPESSDESTSETESDDDTIEQPQDESRVEVFYQFQQSDEIARRDLPKALEALGFMCPQEAWLAAAWKSVKLPQEAPPEMIVEVQQVEKVDLEDFLKIVQAYENRHHLEFATAFATCDKNGSGVVESSELADLLLNMSIEPMSHVLDEVIDEVDTSGLGTLNLDEFKSIMQLIQMREGFSKSEYEEFIAVFQRFDRDNSNECDAAELASILNWLGFAWSRDRMKAVLKEVDVDQSGSLDLREFILCMRKVGEVELKAVKKAMADADADGNGLISKSEMPDLLKGLGYDPWDVHVILEAQRRAGLEGEQELELGQVWQVLTVYRRYDGFTMAQCEKFHEIFEEHCDCDKETGEIGEMESIEVPKAFRSLGFKITFEVVQSVIGRVDVDDTGTLSISEFRKMIRMLEERESNVYRQAFRENAKAESISVTTAQEIARKMGSQLQRQHLVFDESVDEAEIHITEEAFTRACSNLSQEMREIYRQNGGFSTEELKELQVMFDRYDSRKIGKIANKDLVRLVETVCPSLAREKSLRPQLQDMTQACQEFKGCLRFKDFLKLMRLISDFQDKERAQTEATCIKNTGFNSSEVQDFRELFLEMDEGYGVVTFESCRSMIHAITPLGDNLTHQLKRIFDIQTRKKVQNGRGNTDEADFPEFLLLMKQLLDMNFAKLREKIGFDR